jgi:hypothetical protein
MTLLSDTILDDFYLPNVAGEALLITLGGNYVYEVEGRDERL